MQDALTLKDPRAAAAFRNARQRRILFALMTAERSLAELSELTETPLNLLHHHIRRLLGLGLVKLTGERRRAGAPIKLYRASAEAFFVPAEIAEPVGPALNARLRAALERGLAGASQGVLYALEGPHARMRLIRDPDVAARAAELWIEVDLSDAEAAALAEALRTVLRSAKGAAASGRRRYIVHAALAPAPD